MVGGYNKGGYLGRHEEPRCYGPQQQPWSRPILEATRDRGCRRVPGLRMFKLRWDQPAGCRLVRSRQFSPNAACGQRAAKFSACFLFRRESCFILALPEAFYLPRTEVLGIPNGELNHEGCSLKGLLCGRWLEAGPRGRRLLGEGHEVFTVSCGGSSLFKATRPGSQCALASALGLAQGSPPGTKPHTMRPA